MQLQSVATRFQIHRSQLEDAVSLWRRQVEAKRMYGDVDVCSQVNSLRVNAQESISVYVEIVLDCVSLGTFVVISTGADQEFIAEPSQRDIGDASAILTEKRLYMAVLLMEYSEEDVYYIEEGYLVDIDVQGFPELYILGNVLKDYLSL